MYRELLTILMLLVALGGKSQSKEGFTLFTDRDLYTSGESILIKGYAPSDEPSGILNVDLFNRHGNLVSAISLEMLNHQANGFIHLQDTLSSGNYLLRTTTRTSLTQTVKELFISNRFTGMTESNVVLRQTGIVPMIENSTPVNQIEGIGKANKTTLNSQFSTLSSQLSTLTSQIQFDGVGNTYKPREKGHTKIRIPVDFLAQIDGNVLVDIAPVATEYTASAFFTKSNPKYFRETGNEGIIISGTVTDLQTEKPFNNALVYLTIPDSLPLFKYYTTGENGRFYFQLTNIHGKIPVVLQCLDKEKKRLLKITLTPSDDLKNAVPSGDSRTFSPEFKKSMAKNVESLNFRKIFGSQELDIQVAPAKKADTYPFYGIPTRVVRPKQFVDLLNFAEIARELLPQVKFRTYNRIPTLQLFNFQRNNFFNEQPLVLLNGIPVSDLNVIKEMGTREIDRIDICQTERFFGNLCFQGVLAIYSTNCDNSRVMESDDLIKLNLEAIQPNATLANPPETSSKVPDLRQVLLWNPTLKPENTIELDFQTSDIRGNYRLILRGKNLNGQNFYKEQLFEVK